MASNHPSSSANEPANRAAPPTASADGAAPSIDSAKVLDILRQRPRLDDTLPPTPLKQLLSSGGANIYVLSTDSELCGTIERAGGDHYPVFIVASWPELYDAVQGGRCGIALLDAALLGDRLEKRIDELHKYAGRVVTLVAAGRDQAQDLIGHLSERKIHRLLIMPPAVGITRLLLESAVSRCIQMRERPNELTTTQVNVPAMRRALSVRSTQIPAAVLGAAIVALLLGALLVAGITQWRSAEQPSTTAAAVAPSTEPIPDTPAPVQALPAEPSETAPAAGEPDRFAEFLALAERAYAQGRVTEPPGDNALDYYRTILSVEPTHAVARAKLDEVLAGLFARAEQAFFDNALDDAASALASVRLADPTSTRLRFYEAQLESARGAGQDGATAAATQSPLAATVTPPLGGAVPGDAAAAAADGAAAPRSVELDSLLTIAAARLERGQLTRPAGDSAIAYVERAQQLDADDPGVIALREQLAEALTNAARVALDARNLEDGVALVAQARTFGAPANTVTRLEGSIATLRAERAQQRNTELAAIVRERLETNALLAPEDDSALYHLATLEAEDSSFEELPALWAELTSALASNARAAIAAGDWTAAESWLAGLERAGRDSLMRDSLRRELDAARVARLQAQYLATAAPASELALIESVAPEYPRDAITRGIEGSVLLEYTVNRRGEVTNIAVLESDPPRRFDEAAVEAVSGYRYEPFTRDGQAYDRRVQLRVRFALE